MKTRLNEIEKIDIGVVPHSLASSNATGEYYDMSKYRQALAVLDAAAMAKTKTAKVELLQAKDAAAGSSKVITGASATITANVNVAELTILLATVLAGEAITINGLVFTAHATVTTPANREFSISGADAADAAELLACINDATYGVPGVTATIATATLTLKATDPGEKTVSAASSDATFTVATTKALAYVEIYVGDLDRANDFTHVAAKVTTDATIVVGVLLLRGIGRYTPEQQVAASKAL